MKGTGCVRGCVRVVERGRIHFVADLVSGDHKCTIHKVKIASVKNCWLSLFLSSRVHVARIDDGHFISTVKEVEKLDQSILNSVRIQR